MGGTMPFPHPREYDFDQQLVNQLTEACHWLGFEGHEMVAAHKRYCKLYGAPRDIIEYRDIVLYWALQARIARRYDRSANAISQELAKSL